MVLGAAILFTVVATAAPAAAVAEPELREISALSPEQLRGLLQGLLRERKSASGLTRDRVAALKALAPTDPAAAQWLARFPARLVVTVEGAAKMEEAAFRSSLARVFREVGLDVASDAPEGGTTVRVHVAFDELSSEGTVLAGSGMRSYSAALTGAVEARDGTRLASFAAAQYLMGINLGFGAQDGADRTAALACDGAVRAIALSVAGGVPGDEDGMATARLRATLERARGRMAALRERAATDPAVASALAAAPFRVELVFSERLDPRGAAVLGDEVRRLLSDVGVPTAEGPAARGTLRIALDLEVMEPTRGPMSGGWRLVGGVKASDGDGGALAAAGVQAPLITSLRAGAALAANLRADAAAVVDGVTAALAAAVVTPASLPPALRRLGGVVPLGLVVVAAGFGDPVADELFADQVAMELPAALREQGVAAAPAALARGALRVRVARGADRGVGATYTVALPDGGTVTGATLPWPASMQARSARSVAQEIASGLARAAEKAP